MIFSSSFFQTRLHRKRKEKKRGNIFPERVCILHLNWWNLGRMTRKEIQNRSTYFCCFALEYATLGPDKPLLDGNVTVFYNQKHRR
mmetsp:Transcript_29253/g.57428  ORF Transcript_29253/g.57428 Transcript_29253/m.57428 type:complete len:86 (-) Transcript_29253:66-323(-)